MKANRRLRAFATVVIAAQLLAACGPDTGSPDATRLAPNHLAARAPTKDFIAWDGVQNFLISRVLGGTTLRVCLQGTGVSTSTQATYQTHITNAIMTWVNGARGASTTSLITTSNITFTCASQDVTVDWSASSGRAHAGQGWVNLYSGDGFATVLHEFGHVFGIGDTYMEGVWTCLPGQPNSVMCGNGGLFSALQPDDINAIQEVFCMAYGNLCTRRWQSTMHWCNHNGAQFLVGDFDGDGRSDMLCHDINTGYKWIANSTAAGEFPGTNWFAPMSWCNHATAQLHLGDFDGDGRTDMLCHDTATGNKWVTLTDSAGQFTNATWYSSMNWCNHASAQLHLGDFNGDGRTDMLCHDTATGAKWIAYADASGHFTGTNWYSAMTWCNHASGRLYMGDFNGDGRTDMLCHDIQTGYKWIALADAAGQFAGTSRQWQMQWCNHSTAEFHVGHFNADRVDDFLCHDTSTGYKWVARQY